MTAIAAGGSHNLALVGGSWTLEGFLDPVDTDVLNTVKAGATVPLKFRVHDGTPELTDPAVVGSFTVERTSCTAEETASAEELALTTTGATQLRYTDGAFQQNWKTPKTPGCYQVTLATTDGTTLTADFLLR
ncbi:MAG TPA: PxKF domain-containing protein [Ornithinicoccus sp.]|nr:PxKF domain-containing protein [Ornithinicoccus sp.]